MERAGISHRRAVEEEASEVEVDVADCEHINYSGSDMWDKY